MLPRYISHNELGKLCPEGLFKSGCETVYKCSRNVEDGVLKKVNISVESILSKTNKILLETRFVCV